jgi:hypothetical protein
MNDTRTGTAQQGDASDRNQRASYRQLVSSGLSPWPLTGRSYVDYFWEGTMRLVVVAVIALVFTTTAHAQDPNQTRTSTNHVTQDLAYPTRGYLPPRISLQRSLRIAEGFIKKDRIDISSCYLIEATWVVDETNSKNGGWRFIWAHTSQISRNVLIAVSVDGKPYRIHLL